MGFSSLRNSTNERSSPKALGTRRVLGSESHVGAVLPHLRGGFTIVAPANDAVPGRVVVYVYHAPLCNVKGRLTAARTSLGSTSSSIVDYYLGAAPGAAG